MPTAQLARHHFLARLRVQELGRALEQIAPHRRIRSRNRLYDRLVTELESSEYVSASLYNLGLCLQALGNLEGAAERHTKVRTLRPQSEDVKDSSFLLTEVLIQLERWSEAQNRADELLAREVSGARAEIAEPALLTASSRSASAISNRVLAKLPVVKEAALIDIPSRGEAELQPEKLPTVSVICPTPTIAVGRRAGMHPLRWNSGLMPPSPPA